MKRLFLNFLEIREFLMEIPNNLFTENFLRIFLISQHFKMAEVTFFWISVLVCIYRSPSRKLENKGPLLMGMDGLINRFLNMGARLHKHSINNRLASSGCCRSCENRFLVECSAFSVLFD